MTANPLTGILPTHGNTLNLFYETSSITFSQRKESGIVRDITIGSSNCMRDILGISLGTRLVGLAVVHDGELIDFRVRKFTDAWSNDKRVDMLRAIEQPIKHYGIKKIVVKVPKPHHCSQSINDLSDGIIALGERHNIRVTVCTISTILRKDKERTLKNKRLLIQSIVDKYSGHTRLAKLYAKEQKNHAPYYVKLFEAIACTEL